jgi:hypothetical protein
MLVYLLLIIRGFIIIFINSKLEYSHSHIHEYSQLNPLHYQLKGTSTHIQIKII